MIAPGLLPWIEQGHDFARDRIERGGVIGFGIIAWRASEAQIRFGCYTALRFGNNVIEFQRRADDVFGGLAIATPMRVACGNLVPKRRGDVRLAHLRRLANQFGNIVTALT